jgi:hypothetical protein
VWSEGSKKEAVVLKSCIQTPSSETPKKKKKKKKKENEKA